MNSTSSNWKTLLSVNILLLGYVRYVDTYSVITCLVAPMVDAMGLAAKLVIDL